MENRILTLGHSPDPDDAFMFYGLARELIPTHGFRFEHVLRDIQTLNERATRGELDVSAISIHAYAHVSGQYALLPTGASMGDGYGPMLVAKRKFTREEIARKKIAVPGTMTSAFLALQLWLDKPARELDFCGVFRLSKDGKLTLLTKELTRPNGIAFSPDEKKLYIVESRAQPNRLIWAYDVGPDGMTLSNKTKFIDANGLHPYRWKQETK